MKGFILIEKKTAYKNAYTLNFKTLYTPAKLVIPKKDGKPTLNGTWYVYYRYRNPDTGALDKFELKQGINRLKTIAERKKAGNNLKKAVNRLLQEGFNPFEKHKEVEREKDIKKLSVLEALDLAYAEKEKVWSESTNNVNKVMFSKFSQWIEKKNLNINIKLLEKKHVSLFLKQLNDKKGNGLSNTSRNNYKRFISSLVTQLVIDDVLKYNFVKDIPLLKSKAEKNTPFTKEQLVAIKEWCLINDPYLYEFIKFVMYGFLRPIEVSRIKLIDIDLPNSTIKVRTKTEEQATILIIEPLKDYIKSLNIEQYPLDSHLFSKKGKPATWKTSNEKSKADFFTRKFKKLKKEIGEKIKLTENHTIYSVRHSAVLDLYTSFKNQGLTDLQAKHKLMTITRHKSLSGLENYLRGIGASLPENYADDYTIDF